MLKNFLIKLWDVFPFFTRCNSVATELHSKSKTFYNTHQIRGFILHILFFFVHFIHSVTLKTYPLYPCLICPTPIINQQPSINYQPSTNNHQPSIIHHPSSIFHLPSSIIHHPSTNNHQPPLLNPKGKSKESQRKVKGKYN